jgi:hypothetical protein
VPGPAARVAANCLENPIETGTTVPRACLAVGTFNLVAGIELHATRPTLAIFDETYAKPWRNLRLLAFIERRKCDRSGP